MEQIQIKFTNQLNENQKKQVALLYYRAFIPKFKNLWVFTLKEEKAVNILTKSISYENGIYAINENDEVLGFVGLEKNNYYYTNLSYSSFRQAYSTFDSLWRYLAYKIYRFFRGKNNRKSYHIDPIVVSEHARGKGIGSRLFDEVFKKAKNENINSIILEVVDTNPKAFLLYSNLGFTIYKTENSKLLTSDAGFNKIYYMEKIIE